MSTSNKKEVAKLHYFHQRVKELVDDIRPAVHSNYFEQYQDSFMKKVQSEVIALEYDSKYGSDAYPNIEFERVDWWNAALMIVDKVGNKGDKFMILHNGEVPGRSSVKTWEYEQAILNLYETVRFFVLRLGFSVDLVGGSLVADRDKERVEITVKRLSNV